MIAPHTFEIKIENAARVRKIKDPPISRPNVTLISVLGRSRRCVHRDWTSNDRPTMTSVAGSVVVTTNLLRFGWLVVVQLGCAGTELVVSFRWGNILGVLLTRILTNIRCANTATFTASFQ